MKKKQRSKVNSLREVFEGKKFEEKNESQKSDNKVKNKVKEFEKLNFRNKSNRQKSITEFVVTEDQKCAGKNFTITGKPAGKLELL